MPTSCQLPFVVILSILRKILSEQGRVARRRGTEFVMAINDNPEKAHRGDALICPRSGLLCLRTAQREAGLRHASPASLDLNDE